MSHQKHPPVPLTATTPRRGRTPSTPGAATVQVQSLTRGLSLRRNAGLKLRSTPQSATGIQAARVVQTSMGFTGGSFNTREFFHGATPGRLRAVLRGFVLLAFVLPLVLLALARGSDTPELLVAAFGLQFIGLGLIGEYLGRVYNDVRARPRYHIEKISGAAPAENRP